MSSAAPTAPLAPWGDPPAPAAASTAMYRDGPGDLRIDPRVIRKLSAQAANEVDGVTGASAGPVARAIHHPVPASTPFEQLAIDLDLTVTITYPRALRVAGEQLASHVSQRVEELAGRPVRDLSVHVEHLKPLRERVG